MAQQKSAPDVRLLTPAVLREIRAKVLRWIHDNPQNIRALMSQGVEMIESIIRYRLRDKLGAATPKTPVLGGIGVAYAPDDYTDKDRRLYMDTGMAVQSVSDQFLNIDPITVYAGQQLQDYAGTVMPDSTTDYLIGEGTGPDCPTFADTWTWGSEGEYVSAPNIGTDMGALLFSACGTPGKYSGLLKLAAQAKLGAGRSPAELSAWYRFPCSLDPISDGLFKDDNGVYWAIRTDEDGCKCAKLTTENEHAQCMHDWVQNGDLTEDDATRAEAYVMSTLEPEKVGGSIVEYTLLTAEEIADVYVNNLSPLGNVWGWAYSRGHLGVDEGLVNEAVIVTHRVYWDIGVVKYSQATLARVEFDLTGAVPTAVLVIDEQDIQWEPSTGDLIFYPTYSTVEGPKLCYVERFTFDSVPQGVDAPIYAFYREDGLEVLRYSYRAPGNWSNDGAHNFPGCCGCGSSQDYETMNISGNRGGLAGEIYTDRTEVRLNTFQFSDNNALISYRRSVMSVGGSGHRTCNGGLNTNIPTQVKIQADYTACSGTTSDDWPGLGNYRYELDIGSASGFVEEYTARAGPIRRIAIIPHGDREAVYLAETFESTYMLENTTTPIVNPSNPIACYITIIDRDTELVIDSFPSLVSYAGGFGIGTLPCSTAVNALYDTSSTVIGETGPYKGRMNEVALVTSKGVIRSTEGMSTDYDDWYEWYEVYLQLPPLDNCTGKTQWTQTSFFHGDAFFSVGPSTSKALITEYDIATPPTTIASIVVALGWN